MIGLFKIWDLKYSVKWPMIKDLVVETQVGSYKIGEYVAK